LTLDAAFAKELAGRGMNLVLIAPSRSRNTARLRLLTFTVHDITMIHLWFLFCTQLARSRFVGPGAVALARQYAINGS
jgi:hypothetical protein